MTLKPGWYMSPAPSRRNLGYAAEVWSRQALAKHIREHAVEAGFPALSRAAKATVHRILAEQPLHPEKVKYYLERRDPNFEAGMREGADRISGCCVTECKAGRWPDRFQYHYRFRGRETRRAGHWQYRARPAARSRQTSAIGRDHEYKRLGTCSILAALDLQDGHVTARVEDRHRSIEFIGLLSDLDKRYPPECTIRIILDNHSAHISKETRAFLSKHPNRFQYVLTPKHGSWLNIVETLFGKMARELSAPYPGPIS